LVLSSTEANTQIHWRFTRAFRAVRLSDVVALVVKALAYITEQSQLNRVVVKEDYEDAARIKVAIAASTTNDTVCRVMAQLNKAIKEERYKDASFIRDYASAGLHVLMLMKVPRESDASDPIAPLELPHSLHPVRFVSQPDALKEVSFQAYHNGSDYHLSEQRLMVSRLSSFGTTTHGKLF
ncbi:hypothetical protein Tco_1232646, partial [Tanacetum coccineum]